MKKRAKDLDAQIIAESKPNKGTSITLTMNVQGQDPVTDNWTTLISAAGVSAIQMHTFQVYPGSSNDLALPRRWRVNVAHSAANSITYSLGAGYQN